MLVLFLTLCGRKWLKRSWCVERKSKKTEKIFITQRQSPSRLGRLFKHRYVHCVAYLAKALKKRNGMCVPSTFCWVFLPEGIHHLGAPHTELFSRTSGSSCFSGEQIEHSISCYLPRGFLDYGLCLVKKTVLHIWLLLNFG